MNNLHGWAMSGYVPFGGLMFLKNFNEFDVNSISEKSPIGHILEVDLEYPVKLHALRNVYPLAPENLAIPYDMLSNYCKNIAEENGIKVGDATKLIPNWRDKTNCVLYQRNLQLHLPLGTKLFKIHRVLKFKQSDWMKKYIDFNTEKTTNAVNSFEKKLFQMMINSVYDKLIESL